MCLFVLVCVNFRDEILLREEECKTRKKFNFSEKWQNGNFGWKPEISYISDDETDFTIEFVS